MGSRRSHVTWRLTAWTILGTLAGAFLTSPAAAQGSALLVDCPNDSPGGDGVSRGFYLVDFPGQQISRVELWLSSSERGPYRMRLTVRRDFYNGPIVGTSEVTVTLNGNVNSPTLTRFAFPNSGAPPGSRLTFALTRLSGSGAVFYATSTLNDLCPIVQTTGTSPPLDSPRFDARPVAVRIYGTPLPSSVVVNCPLFRGGGDGISRGFYVPEFPSTTLGRVDLWTSATEAGSYNLRLTARRGAYNGTIIAQDTAVVNLLGDVNINTLTVFDLPDRSVTAGSTVAFIVEKVSGPGAVFYSTQTTNDDCPIVQTTGTSPPLDSPRFGGRPIAIRIWGVPLPDLVAGRLEVTQACQDLNNSVRLVAGKRCFVRFHCTSSNGNHSTYAVLRARRGAAESTLFPIGGSITVRPSPDRGTLGHSFLFELPSFYRQGTVTLTGELNPDLSWRDRSPAESSYANNTRSVTVTFENVPTVNLVVYRVGYKDGSTTYYPPSWQRSQMVDWCRRAYPADDIRVWNRSYYYGDSIPTCGQVNGDLLTKKLVDVLAAIFFGSTIPINSHYYGMVDDRGGFMRGCADDIPSLVAAGPTGVRDLTFTGGGRWMDWDTDGTYGDWYGGHEIAHSYGRFHAEFCGGGGGVPYPYPNSDISPSATGNTAIYGFDIGNRAIYGPNWHDLMGYCDKQWVSDFTYEGLMNSFQGGGAGVFEGIGAGDVQGEGLLIIGTIEPRTGRVDLRLPLRLPFIPDLDPRTPGRYTIQLRDSRDRALAEYPFTPDTGSEGGQGIEGRDVDLLFISEFVPYVDGTTTVQIVGPGNVDAKVSAGPRPPVVRVTSPNGGEQIDSDPISVSWTASDPDRDRLSFCVQYSPDSEVWETVAFNLSETSVDIDRVNIPAGKNARFRVIATDGINSAQDDSDRPFVVVNSPPDAQIDEPVGAITITQGDTLALEGSAYDNDDGTLNGSALRWNSNINGVLGEGASLGVSGLKEGAHTITLRATDSSGEVATDTVRVTVVVDPTDLPPEPQLGLAVAPTSIAFDLGLGLTNELLDILNVDPSASISWAAQTNRPWIGMSTTRGSTPDEMLVGFVDTGLPPGQHRGEITFTSANVPRQVVRVPVTIEVPSTGTGFLRGDVNDDGKLDIADPSFWLNHLFIGGRAPSCLDAADSNDSGTGDLSDSVYSLNFLFIGGPPPPPPFPNCGIDPTNDALGPCDFGSCP